MILSDLFSPSDRPNAEGWVVHTTDGRMVKVKQEDHVRLHRIAYGLSELAIREMGLNQWEAEGAIGNLPEEFQEWAEGVYRRLVREANDVEQAAWDAWWAIEPLVKWSTGDYAPEGENVTREDRAGFAKFATQGENPHPLFHILDEKYDEMDGAIWKMVRPKGVAAASSRPGCPMWTPGSTVAARPLHRPPAR